MPSQHYLNLSKPRKNAARAQQGFTLIEIIVGIVTLGISIVLLSVIIFPQAQRSAEPILQSRAATLGQAILDEIMSKSFDENSDRSGGAERCGETGATSCTLEVDFGPDGAGETRDRFNDVDDYDGLNDTTSPLEDALGDEIAARYSGFGYAISVCYSDSSGECLNTGAISLFKRVEVTVTTSLGQDFQFSAIRGNY